MIRVKENKKSLNGLKGSYAYSHVDEYGNPVDLNVVTDTYLDNEGLLCGYQLFLLLLALYTHTSSDVGSILRRNR